MIEKGKLHYGVGRDGVQHVDFEVGSLTVDAYMWAEEARLKAEGAPEGIERQKAIADHTLEVLSRRLVRLGALGRADLTPGFLKSNLMWPDCLLMLDACGRLDRRLENFREAQQGDAEDAGRDGAAHGLEPGRTAGPVAGGDPDAR